MHSVIAAGQLRHRSHDKDQAANHTTKTKKSKRAAVSFLHKKV